MTPAAARVRVLVGLFVALALPLTAVADGALAEVPANPALLIESLFRSARYDSVLAVVDDALGRAQATGDSVLLGRMLTQRGRVYLMTGRLAEAELAIATGIQIARSVRDTTGWMPALTFKGYALASMGRLDEAVACYERRLFLARHVRSLLDEAWALTNTGYVRLQRGQLVHAREDYERAIALFRQGGRTDLELTPLIGLGRTLSALGATHEAGRCYQRAWIVAREIGDRENEMWATNNLGAIESVTGDMGRAHQYASRAHLIAKEMGYARGAVAPAINIATWITELGEYQRAAEILAEARELCERTGSREYIAKLDYQRASLLLAPREPRAAAAEFRRLLREGRLDPLDADYARIGLAVALAAADSAPAAIELLEPLLASGQPWHAEPEMSAHLVLSRLLARQGDYAASLVHATRAREAADKLGWRRFAVSARLRESASLRALGRREKARVSLAAALDSLEVARGVVRRAEWREAFGQGLTGDVFDACQVLLEEPESIPRPARERVFFDTIQRFKARTLAERISEPRAGAVPSAAASARPPGLEQLQADVLRNDELFIDIVAGPVASYLFAITSDSLRLVPLPGSGSPLALRVQTYRQILADAVPASQRLYSAEQILTLQRSMGRAVLGEVADLVARTERLIVSPDGFYALVPWGTLVVPSADGDAGARMLMETHEVAQVPSVAALTLMRAGARERRQEPARIAVLVAPGDRGLSGTIEEAMSIRHDFDKVEIVRGLEDGGANLASIAGRSDVLHIAAHALTFDESPWNSGFALAPREATGSRRPETPEAQADSTGLVVLSRADSLIVASTFRADPWLRAWRIAALSLPLDLVVLAGCETAGGRFTTGEGVLGLTSAFVSAGVPVVVSSLWPIADRETARMMRAFYRHLAGGKPVSSALQAAQLEVRASPGAAHPFYWAGFTVVGDGSAVLELQRSARPWGNALVVALIAAGATVVVAVRRTRARRSSR